MVSVRTAARISHSISDGISNYQMASFAWLSGYCLHAYDVLASALRIERPKFFGTARVAASLPVSSQLFDGHCLMATILISPGSPSLALLTVTSELGEDTDLRAEVRSRPRQSSIYSAL